MPSKLTKAAKGQECTIQLFPYCNFNPETTVFAHAPSEDKGMARKSPDWWALILALPAMILLTVGSALISQGMRSKLVISVEFLEQSSDE